LSKLLPPESLPVKEVALEHGIHVQTVYSWLKQVRDKGQSVPEHYPSSANYSDAAKFSVVVETASLCSSLSLI